MGDMSRRRFLRTSAQGVALAAVPLIFKTDPLAAFTTPAGYTGKIGDFYTHFGVDEQILKDVMAAALSKGGDYCDLYFQHSVASTVVLEDDVVSRAYTSVDLGVGIRVLEGDQTGYSFTEQITPESMKLAARTAASIAATGGAEVPQSFSVQRPGEYYPIETNWEDVRIDSKIPYMQAINERMTALEPSLVKRRVYLSDQGSYILCATSDGKVSFDYQPMARLSAACTAEKDGRRESGSYTVAGRFGMERYTPDILDRVAATAIDRTMTMFEAVKPQAGEMPVVLGAGHSGILLHEAIGHGMEADANRKNESIYADRIGKPIAEPIVSIVDDGTNPAARGAINVDDECNESQNTMLVENGVLQTYMHDRISSEFYGVNPTGNGRRQSFRFPPMPRMRSTYMLNGPHERDEIIKSVKKGIYCQDFTNGEVRIGPGDFTFYVKIGNLIEDGKLTAPVKDINLIGNGPQVLERITMVANDFELSESGWTCGKGGQSVPVSLGQPTVLVSSITVGGVG